MKRRGRSPPHQTCCGETLPCELTELDEALSFLSEAPSVSVVSSAPAARPSSGAHSARPAGEPSPSAQLVIAAAEPEPEPEEERRDECSEPRATLGWWPFDGGDRAGVKRPSRSRPTCSTSG